MKALLKLTAAVLGAIPIQIRCRLGYALGYLFSFLPTRERRVAASQLRFAFGAKSKQILPRVYASLGETLLESLNLQPMLRKWRSHCAIINEELMDVALASKRPVLFLTAHTGNWEMIGAVTIAKGFKLSTVARPARNPAFQELLSSIRSGYGLKVHWRGSDGAPMGIIKELKSNRAVAALIDQDLALPGVFLPFFGIPSKVPTAFLELGLRCNAIILGVYGSRVAHGHYNLEVVDLGQGSTAEILTRYNQNLERVIRGHPSQWVWFHKRWRTLTDGRRLSTEEYLKYFTKQFLNGLSALVVLLSGCLPFSSPITHLEKAEEYSREGKFDRAITEYERHIAFRLSLPDRPEWENPYFYSLLIGDLYLREEDVEKSLASYETAEQHGVDVPLVSDRYRMVAHWYESRGDLTTAIQILTKYRDRDPMMFDDVLDRLSKEIVKKEDLTPP